jgi:hypothetical protein
MGSSEANVRLHVFFGRRKLYTLLTVAARHRNAGGVGMPQVQERAFSGGIRRFGGLILIRLLQHNQPIEAYCAVCDEFWPISVSERAALAAALTG